MACPLPVSGICTFNAVLIEQHREKERSQFARTLFLLRTYSVGVSVALDAGWIDHDLRRRLGVGCRLFVRVQALALALQGFGRESRCLQVAFRNRRRVRRLIRRSLYACLGIYFMN